MLDKEGLTRFLFSKNPSKVEKRDDEGGEEEGVSIEFSSFSWFFF